MARQMIADVLGDRARPYVVCAAGPEADQDVDRLAFEEVLLRLSGGGKGSERQGRDGKERTTRSRCHEDLQCVRRECLTPHGTRAAAIRLPNSVDVPLRECRAGQFSPECPAGT